MLLADDGGGPPKTCSREYHMNTYCIICMCRCSRTPLIRINWDGDPSGYAEYPDNWSFLWK